MFERKIQFTIGDLIHAKEQYEKMLHMAEIKSNFLKTICLADPMDKLHNDIVRATLTEIIHLQKMNGAIDRNLDKFLKEIEGGRV